MGDEQIIVTLSIQSSQSLLGVLTLSGSERFVISFKPSPFNPDFTLNTTSALCDGVDAHIEIENAQKGVTYAIFSDSKIVSNEAIGSGGTLHLTVSDTSLVAGVNSFLVQSSLCGSKVEKSVIINVERKYSVSAVETGMHCGEGTVTIKASGAPDTGTYNWYEQDSPDAIVSNQHSATYVTAVLGKSKTYYVSIVNALGCEGSRLPVTADIVNLDRVLIEEHGMVLVSNYTEGIQWYFNNEIIPGATGNSITPAKSGTYTLEVLTKGCSTSASYEFVAAELKLNEPSIKLYPNPVVSDLLIEMPATLKAARQVKVIDELGVTIGAFDLSDDNNGRLQGMFSMTGYPAGIYVVQVIGEGESVSVKVVKK